MKVDLVKVEKKDHDILYRLLEYSLYDGSQYIDNDIDENGVFPYTYFENYFKDTDREAYFIKCDDTLVGFTMLNKHLKVLDKKENNYSVAEFLIMPRARRQHIGKLAAYKVFDLHKGYYEVQPMDNNPIAKSFWDNVINSYTEGNYELKHFDDMEDVYVFKSRA